MNIRSHFSGRPCAKRARARNSGAAAVEFAIVFPLLVATLIAFIDLIFVMHNYSVITNAAREGARRGIVYVQPRPQDPEIKGVARTYASNNIVGYIDSNLVVNTTTNSPSCTTNCECGLSGDYLTVNVTYNGGASGIMYGIYRIVLPNIALTATTTMRCE